MVSTEITDEAVAARVQQGDVEAFGILVERYEEKLLRYARRFLLDLDDAKDLVQQALVNAYINIQSFDISRKFSSWIYRIAHNEFINSIKRQNRLVSFSLFDFDTFLPHLVSVDDIESQARTKEIRELLERSLDKLDPKYREPLVLYYFEDMDYKAIADILRIPVSTVGVRLARGKALVQKLVAPHV